MKIQFKFKKMVLIITKNILTQWNLKFSQYIRNSYINNAQQHGNTYKG